VPRNQAHDPERSRPVGYEFEVRLMPRRQAGSWVLGCGACEQELAYSLVGDDCARVVERALVAAGDGYGPTLWRVDLDISDGVAVEITRLSLDPPSEAIPAVRDNRTGALGRAGSKALRLTGDRRTDRTFGTN